VNGFLSDSLDANEFAGMLTALVNDASMLRRMAVENRAVALRRFTPDVVRARLQDIYLQTVSGPCAA
jgi:hypothetical protein